MMDEEERQRKLLAGKQKFAEYQKKKHVSSTRLEKEKKQLKKEDGLECSFENAAFEVEPVSEIKFLTSPSFSEIYSLTVCDEDILSETDVTYDDSPYTCQQLCSENLQDSETLSGNASVICKNSITKDTCEKPARLDYNKRLQEYHNALTRRNSVITQLSETLRLTIDQRDKLQQEASTQADALAREIETLKLQLQQANEFLHSQKGKNGITAQELLEAKNNVIALEQDNLQKVATIETLVQNIAALKSEVLFAKSERTSELDICNKELQNSLKELQAKDYIISTITSENEDLSEKFKNQSLLWQSAQRSVQEKEETIRMLQEEITLRIDENKNMMKNIHQLEDEKVEIKKELQNAINESISLQKQLKDKEAELNNIQQALQEKIIDLSNELHNSKKVIEDYNIQRSEQIKHLLKQFEEASIKTVVNIEGGPAGLCDVHEVSQSYLDFTPTISLSPNASLTSESEMWQEKLREVISERESLETSHKIELKELKEENNALKEKLSSINTCMEEKGLQIEKLIESNLYKDSVIASHQKTIDDSEGKCNVRKHDENCIEIQELKIQLDAAISEKTLCIQSCTDLRNEVDQWKHSFECLQDDFEFMKVNLAEEKNKLQEENESLKLLLESERLQSSSLLLEKESQMNEIDVLKKQYENLKLENAANLTAYDSLNMDFSKKVNEAEKVRQDLSEMKIYVENFMTEKAQHDYDYIKLKHEFEEKCQTVEEIQQKLTLFFNQLHTVVQQNEDFQDCHSVGLIQSDNLDISSKLHEVLDMCVNLRSENEKLRQLFNDDFSSTDCSKCLTLDSGVTEKLQLKNELQYSDDVTDWKTRYDNLLQEKLQLEVELQSVQSETGISNLDIVDCRIGGGKLHTIEEESESVMNNLQDVSVENVSLLVYNEGYTKDEDLSSNINLEINELKNENNELQQVIIKQHSELEDICNILQQEKDSKLVIEEKNKELLADMLSIRQELENLNYKLKDEESSKIVLDSALKELQKVCATYEVEKDNLEKNVIVLKSKLEMEQLDHQIAIQEICTLKEKLDQSLFEDDIETLRKKLERAVTKKEADDITVLSAYLLGSGDPVVCQQNEISESETLNNCLVEDPLKRNECMMVNLAEERQQFVDESSENFMASHSIVEENQQPTHPDVKSGNHQLQREAVSASQNVNIDEAIVPNKNDITVSEGLDNSLTPPEPMTKKGGNEDTEEGDNTDYHPEMLLTDSVNEEVTESYEKAIDITADVVTREALRRAQILDSDLNVAKEELLRQHAEEIDKLENKYCLQIANLKDDLWVDFRAQQAELLESFEVVKEKLLQELRELKNVLKETESKLHDTEMKLKENMELNGRLEEKWTKKLENERFQLQKKIVELENEIQQKEANETSLREELQAQYEEDVENVRKYLEISLSNEAQVMQEKAQALMEAEVDQLQEKIEAESLIRNEENNRLCKALHHLKVQVQQLQADKHRMERLISGEPENADELILEHDNKDSPAIATIGIVDKPDWDQLSNSSEDVKAVNIHLQQLLSQLVTTYVTIAKTVNKELINLIGTDLGVFEISSNDFSDPSNSYARSEILSSLMRIDTEAETDVMACEESFISTLGVAPGNFFQDVDHAFEEFVTEVGEKLTVAVHRLLGMLSASVQQLQEPRGDTDFTNLHMASNDEFTHLAVHNEELSAQLKSEIQTKELLAVEVHKLSGLLKGCETEKKQLEDELGRKERQLEQVVCQLEESQAQNQRLQDSLAEDQRQLQLHQEVIAEGIGEHAQMVKSVWTEPYANLLATGGSELLEENTRLQHERRGLQYRGEKDRNHLMARVHELEQLLEELTASHEVEIEEKRQEINDLQQQIDALDKQLRGYKHFIEEQTAEREQEREEFQREMTKFHDVVREKDRFQSSEVQLTKEIEVLQEQLREKNDLEKEVIEKQELLAKEMANLTETTQSQQDVIRELERQLDNKSRNEKDLNEQMEELKLALSQTTRAHEDQSNEIEELRKLSLSNRMSDTLPFLEEYLDIQGLSGDHPTTAETLLLDLRSQINVLEEKVYNHSRDLEGINLTSSSVSSPCSEEVSVREQLDALRISGRVATDKKDERNVEASLSAYLRDVRRLEEKVDALSRSKDIVLKRMKDIEAHSFKQKQVEEELLQDREVLQQKLNAQLLQISALQARIEERRLGVHSSEFVDELQIAQEDIRQKKEVIEVVTQQVETLQAKLSEIHNEYDAYKKQVTNVLHQRNEELNRNKAFIASLNLEINDVKQQNEFLKTELEKSQKQAEELSSLIQTLLKEKNDEMDLLNVQLQQNEQERETSNHLLVKHEEQVKNLEQTINDLQEKLSASQDTLRGKLQDLQECEKKLNSTEKDAHRAWDLVEQKKREVDALKVVMEEKAELMEQVKTLQAELDDMSRYQSRLQEDFDMLQIMIEEKQQELSELQQIRDASVEEKINLMNQIEVLQNKLSNKLGHSMDIEVQTNVCGGGGDEEMEFLKVDYIKNLQSRIALQEEKLSDSVKNLESLMQLKSRYEFLLETEKDTVKSLNERIHDLTKELEICNEKYGNISADLEQCSTQLKDYSNEIQISKNSLSQAEQQTNRLQAEIAWRDTKIYRLEDELEEIKSSISKGSGIQDGKPSLQRFLEEMRHEVLQEYNQLTKDNTTIDSFQTPEQVAVNRSVTFKDQILSSDDGRLTASTDASLSESDADSLGGEAIPPKMKQMMRKIYKEGVQVFNLSHLQVCQDQDNDDCLGTGITKGVLIKVWENERNHLIAEIQALKDLLSQVTAIAAANRVQDPQNSSLSFSISKILQFVSALLSKEKECLLDHIRIGIDASSKSDVMDMEKLENAVSELNQLYSHLLQSIQKLISITERSVHQNLKEDSTNWEVQMATAKERLKYQEDQKNLMHQLCSLDQQLALNERQAKRQVELLEFRIQQEIIIAEDLRNSLDMEKSRNIELCGQLALEKGRASHLNLLTQQLKTDLANCQLALDHERQEMCTLGQQLKNEKLRAESLFQALQSERDSFTQLQQAMEAEKRRGKASQQREQQIIEELRQTLETERDKQLELTSALEREKLTLQNARRELLKVHHQSLGSAIQNNDSFSTCISDDGILQESRLSTLEDLQEALELEKRKNLDLSSVLQKEHNRVTMMASSLQQERRHLVEENDRELANIAQMQAVIDSLQIQKSNLQKEMKRDKEIIYKLEMESSQLSSDLVAARNDLRQREEDIESLHQIQRDLHRDWDVDRERHRHKQQEIQLENQRLQQTITILEKEMEFLKRNETLIQKELNDERNYKESINKSPDITTGGASSRYHLASIETIRERLYVLLLKVQDEVDSGFSQCNLRSSGISSCKNSFANTISALLTEVGRMNQDTVLHSQVNATEGGTHLDLTERIVKHNAELVKFIMQMNEEKLRLRKIIAQYQDNVKQLSPVSSSHSSTQLNLERTLTAERTAWAQERACLQRDLHRAEANLIRANGELRRQSQLMLASPTSRIEDGKMSYYYLKYLRAQSFRKNLMYQKNYLLIILGGYQDTESVTLEMLGRLGCLSSAYGTHHDLKYSKPFRRFRSLVRVAMAIFRMKFLVRKWNSHFPTASLPPFFQYEVEGKSHGGFDVLSQDSVSVINTPVRHSRYNSFHPGCTPPVRDNAKSWTDSERSISPDARRSSINTASSSSSVQSIPNLSEFVQRYEAIRQQLGIKTLDMCVSAEATN